MKSLDVGTAFIVKGEFIDNDPEFIVERNCFLEAAATDDTEETLRENNWSYAKYDGKYYILGEDAIKLKNLLTINTSQSTDADRQIIMTQVGSVRRPMKDGVLNTGSEKLSVAIIQKIIANLLGPPKQTGEILCFCSPADPIDKNFTSLFHKTMITNFLKSLGYEVECIPEALSIIYSERPVATDPNEGEMPFTGIGVSLGGGMCNVCFCLKKMPLISFSICQSGDWIDEQSAKVSGIDIAAMTRFKETKLDLNNIDYSDMRQAALDIFYQNTIETVLNKFAEKFNKLDSKIDFPLDIVVAGGTSLVPGFIDKFRSVVSTLSLPFTVKDVRHATNPFYTVANGCLLKALSIENKKTDKLLQNTIAEGMRVDSTKNTTIGKSVKIKNRTSE